MAFLEFLKRLYDMESEYLGPEGAGAGPGGMADADAGGDLGSLFAALQGGAEAGRPGRMGGPMLGGGSGPIDLAGRPDAGDLYDFNNSNGDPGLLGLFGSPDPVPLRQPPPGISQRRPGRP